MILQARILTIVGPQRARDQGRVRSVPETHARDAGVPLEPCRRRADHHTNREAEDFT